MSLILWHLLKNTMVCENDTFWYLLIHKSSPLIKESAEEINNI